MHYTDVLSAAYEFRDAQAILNQKETLGRRHPEYRDAYTNARDTLNQFKKVLAHYTEEKRACSTK